MPELLDSLRDALADRYAVERELGRGGMATVFLADDRKHSRPVAIKVLHAELAAALGAERFLREIEIAARLQHPHILPLYDSGSAGGFLYYVMPYVEGESLRDRLTREKQLSLEDTLRVATEVASALAYAHSRGVVHRDIKPENIMLSGGSAVVADFGIARAVTAAGEGQHLTQTGTIIGTPAYMSPEQATGSTEVDGRSDEYSLACVVYEMLVGAPPFTGPTAQAIIARHSMDMVSPPSIVRSTIPDTVEGAILRALSKVPADRYPTTALFAEALNTPSEATGAYRRATLERGIRRPASALRRLVPAAVVVAGLAGYFAIRSARAGRGEGATASGLDPRHLAVLYFDDLSRDHSLGYLADGMTEALIANLSQVQPLSVISRNGVAPYRGGSVPADSIARALGAGTVVTGSVEQVGDLLHVTVRLVDGASGVDFKRASFDERAGDMLTVIRDSLSGRVAEFLRERLGEEVRLRTEQLGTSNVAAWSLEERAERSRKDAEAAVESEHAKEAFADFHMADSLAALAEAADDKWVDPIVFRGQIALRRARLLEDEPREAVVWIRTGLGHAERALRMAPNDGSALELRGTLRYYQWLLRTTPDPAAAQALLQGARQDLESAVQTDPSLASAYSTLSHLYYQVEDVPAAVLAARRAYEQDAYLSVARDILYRLFIGSLDLEQFSQADRWCTEETRRFPRDYRSPQCQLLLMATPVRAPDVGRAWQLVALLDTVTPPQFRPYLRLESRLRAGGVIARAGLKDSARHVFDGVRAASTPSADPGQELLAIEAYERTLLGDRNEAVALLTRYSAANPGHFERGKDISWWWRDLKDDPRFKALVGAK
ncbi:MAG TPA: serine/threonine-protein kinase [Gemmatimonadales bacterium]|nr:serine/threonine-protein kinase [Gemmatimonadales bacterium]